MGVLMELGVAEPVPALNAPTVSHQSQQCFWGCAEAGEKEMFGVERLAVAGSCGGDLNDPACAEPGFTDEVRSLFRSIRAWFFVAVELIQILLVARLLVSKTNSPESV
jgi:hypothetical protein